MKTVIALVLCFQSIFINGHPGKQNEHYEKLELEKAGQFVDKRWKLNEKLHMIIGFIAY